MRSARGANGKPELTYEVDAFRDELGVVVEIESGRGAANNAFYRDLIRACVIVDADYLAIALPLEYWNADRTHLYKHAYSTELRALRAIYESGRLELPLKGVAIFGY